MKQKATIENLALFEDQKLELKAWVSQFRSSGKIAFLSLRDGTGECQAILNEKITESESFKLFSKISLESLVQVQAKVKKWKQGFELEVVNLKILSPSLNYPIAKKAHGVDFLLNHRHLWLRSKRQRSLLKIRSEVTKNIHAFFQKENFIQVSAPILMPTASEGTSSLFSVDFFEEDHVFLSQSGQLHMESACSALSKVYCFGPTFRAEKSSTRRHLLEFWMVEPEMAFYSCEDAMSLAESLVEYIVQKTIQSHSSDFEILQRDLKKLEKIKAPFPKVSYKEACKILAEKKPDFVSGKDFGALEESLLSEVLKSLCLYIVILKTLKLFI